MEEPPEKIKKTFDILPKHEELLSKYYGYGSNANAALRSALDELIEIKKNKKKNVKTQKLNNNLIIFGLGILFILFAIFSTDVVVGYIATLFGIFFVANGIIGGIITEIRRTH